ncbi:DUF89-domain-containing protein [Saitoella complicata NRRL Y-17804]|uniref:Sugar phosphate phosphatase n=1 Tax=Saitoella complicata (strain BCRC 22490 / CBS 7301 / JCM 7358 / NBRC 10748 / NRRL Y-17804) TaxID=698492 RepID=A0A0E9NJL4_SAICN|nr:DUF89-domain-containing protein [Saitoella complicata NRRL Y-17804]ODQ54560.1 DUF89-domain-containing protein [Saitoella complicata NRRL Y-17804]GAO50072.1 hypothetical protein G7K_4207-t1 [Saitoella complicata NRRL Y-17804]
MTVDFSKLDAPLPFYLTSDKKSFAWPSVVERYPIILTQAIDDMHRTISSLPADSPKLPEGKKIIAGIAALKHEEQHDRVLTPLPDDGDADVKDYNDELKYWNEREGREITWFSGPWLYVECYLYRRLHSLFAQSEHWKSYDLFHRQKTDTFRSSAAAVNELAVRFGELVRDLESHKGLTRDAEAQKLLFLEMAQISLWGNATDLSLLTNLSYEDIQKLQGKEAIAKSAANILVNNLDKAWGFISQLKGGRIDFVLDNAGFELFADLIFATYLLETNHAQTIVLHPKDFGWFVSDVLPADVAHCFSQLRDSTFFTPEDRSAMDFLIERWMEHYAEGRIVIRPNHFWTTGHSYWRLPTCAPELHADLQESDLVIFKGDLNFRKLTGDAMWPRTTPWTNAIGPLATSGLRTLSLRTAKADVMVGLREGLEEELDQKDTKWAVNGKFAVVFYHDAKK